jgi:hypothetical protein
MQGRILREKRALPGECQLTLSDSESEVAIREVSFPFAVGWLPLWESKQAVIGDQNVEILRRNPLQGPGSVSFLLVLRTVSE